MSKRCSVPVRLGLNIQTYANQVKEIWAESLKIDGGYLDGCETKPPILEWDKIADS